MRLAPCSLAAPVSDCTRCRRLSRVFEGLDGADVVLLPGPLPGPARPKDSELGGGPELGAADWGAGGACGPGAGPCP